MALKSTWLVMFLQSRKKKGSACAWCGNAHQGPVLALRMVILLLRKSVIDEKRHAFLQHAESERTKPCAASWISVRKPSGAIFASRSRDTLAARVPHLLERVAWLNRLPPVFPLVLAMKCSMQCPPRGARSERKSGRRRRRSANDRLNCVLEAGLRRRASMPHERSSCPRAFRTEIQLAAQGFVRSLSGVLEKGVAFFVDYGFRKRSITIRSARTGP